MQITHLLTLAALFLVTANGLAAMNTAVTPGAAAPANSTPVSAAFAAPVPDVIAYKAFLTMLASVAEQDHHSYLHLLGEAFRVDVDTADPSELQFIDAYGVTLLDRQAALNEEELGIRRHLLCARDVQLESVNEFLYRMGRIDNEIETARNTYLQASLSEMPAPARTSFRRFLVIFGQGVSLTRARIHAQLEAMGSIDAYTLALCARGDEHYRIRQTTGGGQ